MENIATQELWEAHLSACVQAGDVQQFNKLWNDHPYFAKQMMEEFDRQMDDPKSDLRKEHDRWWADLKSKLIEAFGEEWVKENCKD